MSNFNHVIEKSLIEIFKRSAYFIKMYDGDLSKPIKDALSALNQAVVVHETLHVFTELDFEFRDEHDDGESDDDDEGPVIRLKTDDEKPEPDDDELESDDDEGSAISLKQRVRKERPKPL